MKALQIGFGLLIGFGIAIPGLPTTAQAASPKETQTPAAGLRTLTPEDARRTLEREKAGIMARGVDRWDEAIARAQALLAVQARRLGPRHFEAVNAEGHLVAMRRVDPLPQQDRADDRSARTLNEQAETLAAQGR